MFSIENGVLYMENQCTERVHRKRNHLLSTCDFLMVAGDFLFSGLYMAFLNMSCDLQGWLSSGKLKF